LIRQSKKIPGFQFQSLYLERGPNILARAQNTAESVLPEGESQAMLYDRLEAETKKLKALDQQLEEVNTQIAQVVEALKSQAEAQQQKQKAVSVDTTEMEMSTEDIQAKDQLQTQIKEKHQNYLKLETAYMNAEKVSEQGRQLWFKHILRDEATLKQIRSELNLSSSVRVEYKRDTLAHDVEQLYTREKGVIGGQVNYLDKKLEVLSDRLNKLADRSIVHQEALNYEIDTVKSLREDLIRELGQIDGILKQPVFAIVTAA
jgi:hypothetical protein